MSKLLFVHDTKVKMDSDGTLYTGGSYNDTVWKRYLSICDELILVARLEKRVYSKSYANSNFNKIPESVVFIESPSFTTGIINNPMKIKEFSKLMKHLINTCDLLIARIPSINGIILVTIARKLHKFYLVEVVGCIWDALWNLSFIGKIAAIPSYFLVRRTIKNSPYSLYVTQKFLQKRYPCNNQKIGCSDVVLPKIDINVIENRINKIFSPRGDKPIILGTVASVGIRFKGQQYIIKALKKLNSEANLYEYHLVGGGSQDYLKKLAQKFDVEHQVKFIGSIPHESVFDFLDSIDIYIQPSRQEGLPRALLEAMSRGVPSLGSNIGGIPELLSKQSIFSSFKTKDIVCKIQSMIDTETMFQNAYRNYEEAKNYYSDIIDKQRMSFLKEFVETVQQFRNNIE